MGYSGLQWAAVGCSGLHWGDRQLLLQWSYSTVGCTGLQQPAALLPSPRLVLVPANRTPSHARTLYLAALVQSVLQRCHTAKVSFNIPPFVLFYSSVKDRHLLSELVSISANKEISDLDFSLQLSLVNLDSANPSR